MITNALRALAEHDDRRHRLSVEDYHRIGEAGILGPEARVELIEGEIRIVAPRIIRPVATDEIAIDLSGIFGM